MISGYQPKAAKNSKLPEKLPRGGSGQSKQNSKLLKKLPRESKELFIIGDLVTVEHDKGTTQVNDLANFIMKHIKGEPSRSEGAIACAIRLLKEHPKFVAGES